jgi:hypothetical protein
MPVKHKFVSGSADPSDSTQIKPSNWNDSHTITLTVTPISANTTLDGSYEVVTASGGAGGITVTLPSAVIFANQVYIIKKIDSAAGAITIATTSTQTIDGLSTYPLVTQWQYVKVVSDSSNWIVVGNN